MRVTPELIRDLTAELDDARAAKERADPHLSDLGRSITAHQVTRLELALDHAKAHLGQDVHPDPAPAARARPRRTRTEVDRERLPRRLERRDFLAARIAAYEASDESLARNDWRQREAAVNRSLDAWRQYRRDLGEHARLTSLINRTTKEKNR